MVIDLAPEKADFTQYFHHSVTDITFLSWVFFIQEQSSK